MEHQEPDPFVVDGPAVVSFSGGLTSAYMLRRVLDAGLRSDVHVLFADTGKERAETYDFIDACARAWHVPIVRVERPGGFTQLITDKSYLPNPVMRFCTQELKIRPIRDYMRGKGYAHWTNIVGIRADEPRRVARMRTPTREQWDIALPLVDAGVSLSDIRTFWQVQPFTLALAPHEGNCDLCFLKGYGKIVNIVRDRPDLAQWWAEQETRIGATFRNDRPSYRAMMNQPDLFAALDTEDIIECYCHD